jgi:hypothetical protein
MLAAQHYTNLRCYYHTHMLCPFRVQQCSALDTPPDIPQTHSTAKHGSRQRPTRNKPTVRGGRLQHQGSSKARRTAGCLHAKTRMIVCKQHAQSTLTAHPHHTILGNVARRQHQSDAPTHPSSSLPFPHQQPVVNTTCPQPTTGQHEECPCSSPYAAADMQHTCLAIHSLRGRGLTAPIGNSICCQSGTLYLPQTTHPHTHKYAPAAPQHH